jgi:hypothetical protein
VKTVISEKKTRVSFSEANERKLARVNFINYSRKLKKMNSYNLPLDLAMYSHE